MTEQLNTYRKITWIILSKLSYDLVIFYFIRYTLVALKGSFLSIFVIVISTESKTTKIFATIDNQLVSTNYLSHQYKWFGTHQKRYCICCIIIVIVYCIYDFDYIKENIFTGIIRSWGNFDQQTLSVSKVSL